MKYSMNKRASQSGSALVYILIAIALLAALTVTFMEPSSQQSTSQNTLRTVSEIQSQADLIRSAIQQCVLSYQKGDKTIDNSALGTDPFARRNYPIKPNSTHFSSATIGPTAGRLVKDIRCPGDPGNNVNHIKIYGGTSGKYLPPAPSLFGDWKYYNGQDGVFFWIETNKSDAFIQTALAKLDDNYSECEADVIDASGGAIDLDSDSPAEVQCPNGYTCFRVRMVTQSSAIYSGDSDGDEASCP
ncbi:MAG: hypothetical protein KDI13_00615 [Alphaproteobacteria bacterium]|nr:hypothetical protein [Alphaproteobacteria bacterium]